MMCCCFSPDDAQRAQPEPAEHGRHELDRRDEPETRDRDRRPADVRRPSDDPRDASTDRRNGPRSGRGQLHLSWVRVPGENQNYSCSVFCCTFLFKFYASTYEATVRFLPAS